MEWTDEMVKWDHDCTRNDSLICATDSQELFSLWLQCLSQNAIQGSLNLLLCPSGDSIDRLNAESLLAASTQLKATFLSNSYHVEWSLVCFAVTYCKTHTAVQYCVHLGYDSASVYNEMKWQNTVVFSAIKISKKWIPAGWCNTSKYCQWLWVIFYYTKFTYCNADEV